MAQHDFLQTSTAAIITPPVNYGSMGVDGSNNIWIKNASGGLVVPSPPGNTTIVTAAPGTTEAIVAQLQIPANILTTGSSFHIKFWGAGSADTNILTVRVHFGVLGTATGDTLISPAIAVTPSTSGPVSFIGQAVCKSATTWVANGFLAAGTGLTTTAAQTSAITASNVNVVNFLTVTAQKTTGGTVTIGSASIELFKAA